MRLLSKGKLDIYDINDSQKNHPVIRHRKEVERLLELNKKKVRQYFLIVLPVISKFSQK
jgi:hypothetical protein